ncbi:hypothetical protein Fot_35068 [Forsythia ovata]|uniref:Uncharacterized protein n=1 Tax=Forsythia ovata TaxID=205694 RepID=A0ABD1SKG7_9LAMI
MLKKQAPLSRKSCLSGYIAPTIGSMGIGPRTVVTYKHWQNKGRRRMTIHLLEGTEVETTLHIGLMSCVMSDARMPETRDKEERPCRWNMVEVKKGKTYQGWRDQTGISHNNQSSPLSV